MTAVSGKNIIAKTVALNCFSPKAHRITYHAQIFTVAATTDVT